MKKSLLVLIVPVLALQMSMSGVHAQQPTNPVVMEVGGQQVRQAEFLKEFNNNVWSRRGKQKNITYEEKRAALHDYAGLYATFRAKILDAKARGMDTSSHLNRELMRYRKDLAAPYLIDSAELRRLMAEAYERNHYSLHAAHILVSIPIGASDADTLPRYQKACDLYKRIVENGEDFFAVANDYHRSYSPDAEYRPNEGDLGFFSVFDMVYPFENAAYSLKVGEVSRPVRTRYGYHIIKLLDRVEGLFGRVDMAHIWLNSPDSAARLADINMMYRQLQEGADFAQVARQSDDRSTSNNGGLLLDATLSQLPPEYIHKLVGMKQGEYSKPFFTKYGWHIIKLIRCDTLASASEMESLYKQRMTRDQRGQASRKTFAANSRKKYGIKDLTTTPVPQVKKGKGKKSAAPVQMMASLDELERIVPDSVRLGVWRFNPAEFTDTAALVVTPSHRYTSRDVASYIAQHQKRGVLEDMGIYVRRHFEDFIDSVSIDYADSQLENEYPEFADIVNDYRRGLLIFNYNDAMIWRKAQDDSVGFAEFYDQESVKKSLSNPNDSSFFFNPRARVTILDVADSKALPSDKALKVVGKAREKNLSGTEIRNLLVKKIDRKKYKSDDLVKVDADVVEQGHQKLLASDQWQVGTYVKKLPNGGYRLILVDEILPRVLKGHREARGYYLNAWQNEVERRLTEELMHRYHVKINYDVVDKISF